MTGLSLVGVVLLSPSGTDEGLDWLFLATSPVLAVLELLLLLALLRLFKDRDLVLAASMVVAGGASIVAGLASTVLSLAGQEAVESTLIAAAGLSTGVELFLMAALLRRASAKPERLWLWGVAAGVGTAASSATMTLPDALVVIAGLLLLAFLVFLYRLGQLSLPTMNVLSR